MESFELIAALITGVLTAIPLIVALVKWIQKAVKEKNWAKLLDLVMSLIPEAEQKFDDGATRKEWVMGMVSAAAKSINYDIDTEELSELIDSLCTLTKSVNTTKVEKIKEQIDAEN